MLDLIILIVLLAGLVAGYKRGLIVQLLHMTSIIIALIVAWKYYKPLAEKFVLWIPYPAVEAGNSLRISFGSIDFDETFYRLLAFVFIFLTVKLVLHLIASALDFLKYLPVLGSVNSFAGAALGFLEFYLILFFILYIVAMVPVAAVQSMIDSSLFSGAILKHTPIISEMVKNWWYIYAK
ncbi:CvpA family protein [Bhargavaea beijingensis]|uniref:CvpA family protein n=1 Tax=Bhargavaea beijingensis TaxID=426756 RepID=UPI0022248020|nr:CvpA family protein [Bhargavaea beijingensis]MCW1929226.1 CvpA family protein [Bhargavaea beijingensis]